MNRPHDCYDKPLWTLARLGEVLPGLPRQLVRVLPTLWGGGLSNAARERIMLAVAVANRCRYCQLAHSRLGEAAGLSAEELGQILDGEDPPHLSAAERLAVRYARDRAASGFGPVDPELRRALSEHFSEEQCDTIEAVAQVMNFANRFGNGFDALLARLGGRCDATGASWLDLAATSAAFLAAVTVLAGPLALAFAVLRR